MHRPKAKLTHAEALGLAALLNSAIVDRFFRISNGNTQVSAVEPRNLPLPPAETIKAIGRLIECEGTEELDRVVAGALDVPADLSEDLAGTAPGETWVRERSIPRPSEPSMSAGSAYARPEPSRDVFGRS
jgi:hypothetical protein